MAHSTRTPRRTPAQQLDDLVADHARLTATLDHTLDLVEQLTAELTLTRRRLDAIRDLAYAEHAGGATVLRITTVQALLDAPPEQLLLNTSGRRRRK